MILMNKELLKKSKEQFLSLGNILFSPYIVKPKRKILTGIGLCALSNYLFKGNDYLPETIFFYNTYLFTKDSVNKDINYYFKDLLKNTKKKYGYKPITDSLKILSALSLSSLIVSVNFIKTNLLPVKYLFDTNFQQINKEQTIFYASSFAFMSLMFGTIFNFYDNFKLLKTKDLFKLNYYNSLLNMVSGNDKKVSELSLKYDLFSSPFKQLLISGNKKYVDSMGFYIKHFSENNLIDYSAIKLSFLSTCNTKKEANIKRFLDSISLDIYPEIKEHYAHKTIDDILEKKYDFLSEEDSSQILSSIPVFLEHIGKDSDIAWEKYINYTKNKTKKLENLVSSGGTKGVFKKIITKEYEFPITDELEVAHSSKYKNIVEGKYYQTKFLHDNNDEDNFFIYPKPLYLTNYNDETIYIERQYSWKNIEEHILSKKDITQEEIYQIFKDALQTTKYTQDKLGKGFTIDDKKFIFEKEILENKYLYETRLLHPIIQDKKVIEQFLNHIENSNIPWKASTDSTKLNFLVADDYLLKFKNGEKRIAKIDNELSKLLPDAEHFKLLVYAHNFLSEEKFNKLFNSYIDNYDNQLSLSAIMAQSYVRGFGKREDFNLNEAKDFLTFNQKFITNNLNNFSDKMYPTALKQVEELEKYKRNIAEIHKHILNVEKELKSS